MVLFLIIVSILFGIISLDYRITLLSFIGYLPLIFFDIYVKVRNYRRQKYLDWLFEQGRKEKEEKKGGVSDADN